MAKLLKPLAVALLVLVAAMVAVGATGMIAVMLDEHYLRQVAR